MNSNFDSASYDGTGNDAIVFPCGSSEGTYSLLIQEGDDDDDIFRLGVENNKGILKSGTTRLSSA